MEGTFHAILQFITFGFGYGWPLHQEEGWINHNERGVKGGGGDGDMGSWCLSLYVLDIYMSVLIERSTRLKQGMKHWPPL